MTRYRFSEPPPSEITPKALWLSRREVMRAGLALALAPLAGTVDAAPFDPEQVVAGPFSTDEPLTDPRAATGYNNFYEFGTRKSEPAANAWRMQTSPWDVVVEGEVARPGRYGLEDLLRPHTLEERVYRLRCVEGWSMVIPWVGFPLAALITRLEPTSRARYVEFETLVDEAVMPGVRRPVIAWPYREALRMDEALHPLTLLAVGMYGEVMPNQNGAPIRLVVPWKYGFKSIKSIVAIRFHEQRPVTSWEQQAPREYGFYANVNPEVDHPRWSQASERRIGESGRRPTLPFNGYAEQVAHLYDGMDLRRYF